MFQHVVDVHFEHRENTGLGSFFDNTRQDFSRDQKKFLVTERPMLTPLRAKIQILDTPKRTIFEQRMSTEVHRCHRCPHDRNLTDFQPCRDRAPWIKMRWRRFCSVEFFVICRLSTALPLDLAIESAAADYALFEEELLCA